MMVCRRYLVSSLLTDNSTSLMFGTLLCRTGGLDQDETPFCQEMVELGVANHGVPERLHPKSFHANFGHNTNVWATRNKQVNTRRAGSSRAANTCRTMPTAHYADDPQPQCMHPCAQNPVPSCMWPASTFPVLLCSSSAFANRKRRWQHCLALLDVITQLGTEHVPHGQWPPPPPRSP